MCQQPVHQGVAALGTVAAKAIAAVIVVIDDPAATALAMFSCWWRVCLQ